MYYVIQFLFYHVYTAAGQNPCIVLQTHDKNRHPCHIPIEVQKKFQTYGESAQPEILSSGSHIK